MLLDYYIYLVISPITTKVVSSDPAQVIKFVSDLRHVG